MIRLDAWRYDGNSSSRVAVTLVFAPDHVLVEGAGVQQRYVYADVVAQPRIAGTRVQLDFADGSQCEVEEQPQLEAALGHLPAQGVHGFIHKIENHWPSIVLALIAAVAMLFALIQYGIPVMARHAALAIPADVETELGAESVRFLEHLTAPSQLDRARQDELRARFEALARMADVNVRQIIFRHGDALGANAFALPAGTILVTDELVAMAQDDRELLGVFAHELGHVHHRHTLQQVLQNSTTGLLLIVLTGDITSVSSLAAAVPTLLVQMKFSRDAEREADDYAMALLARQDISPSHLGSILQRMEAEAGGDSMPGFLSSHPATHERMRKFTDANP